MPRERKRKSRGPNQICDEMDPDSIPTSIWKQFELIKGRGSNTYQYVAPQEYADGDIHYQLQLYPPRKPGERSSRLKHIRNFKYEKVAALYYAIIKAKHFDVLDIDGNMIANKVEAIIKESNPVPKPSKTHFIVNRDSNIKEKEYPHILCYIT